MDVISTYFVWRNFDEQKINIVWTYFFPHDFDGKKSTSFRYTFFDLISMDDKSDGKLMELRCAYFDVFLINP